MLVRAVVLIAVIAVIDWRVETNVSLGFLYLFPMLMVGVSLNRWQIGVAGALCTFLVEMFDPFPFLPYESIPRDILVFAAFFGAGLFVFESNKNRALTQKHVADLENEMELRRDAEEQLRVLVESSPAAIFTLDAQGTVLMANESAHHLLDVDAGTLPGARIGNFLPALASVPPFSSSSQLFRTEMECPGRRDNGDVFLANIWFSTYRTRSGSRLAAVVVDVSEDLRNREESSLEQFMAGSRIVVASVCHEIRNLCGAIGMVNANLGRNAALAASEDYRALATLVSGLERIASLELRQTATEALDGIDILALLDELHIVIEPSLRDAGIELRWILPPSLPLVWADRHALLQVFLNLTKNSTRAMESSDPRIFTIAAVVEGGRVMVRVEDTGTGVAAPERLFQPFQPGAESTGLGLYVSRALVRGFRGDLMYVPRAQGCCFTISLTVVAEAEDLNKNAEHTPVATGRPHPVSGELEQAARRGT
ncbi:MAG TPA: ATP-binding protein [Bryobacteraceae bacterium]|jgi:two-component system sensor kinase FixL|nr:ATP-binding protein [Bryobacteraceae bacterium]